MTAAPSRLEILVVGAGMAGLTAAATLRERGHEVLVIDKGRGVGGRLASRRIDAATFDHGAQFITVRHPRFAALMEDWRRQGVAEVWFRGSQGRPEGHARWRGTPAMTAVAKHLARGLEVRLGARLLALHRDGADWIGELESGESLRAGSVLLTPPVPQTLALLAAGGTELPSELQARLQAIGYERCLAVLALLAGPSRLPPPGGMAPRAGPIAWIADNQRKGISAVAAVTLHATAAFSEQHWDLDRTVSGRELLRAAEPWLGAPVTEFQTHGWKYSKPLRIEQEPCLVLSEAPPLVVAGDAFAGPRVEGAALSGWAAAVALGQRSGRR
jgi:predicted NAD/FAD-dependent oxidoreductase